MSAEDWKPITLEQICCGIFCRKIKNQPLIQVSIAPPDGEEKTVSNGIFAEDEVLAGITDAQVKIEKEKPDKIITIGGNCLVSLAPFDYLHGVYENIGIVWIDAHPDVSTTEDGYPNAHARVLCSLLGHGASQLREQMKNKKALNRMKSCM